MRRYHWWTHPVLWAWGITVSTIAGVVLFLPPSGWWVVPIGVELVSAMLLSFAFTDFRDPRGRFGQAKKIWGRGGLQVCADTYDSGDIGVRLMDGFSNRKVWTASPAPDWRRLPDLETAMMEAIAMAEELTTNKAEAEARLAQLGRLLDAHSEILKELQ